MADVALGVAVNAADGLTVACGVLPTITGTTAGGGVAAEFVG